MTENFFAFLVEEITIGLSIIIHGRHGAGKTFWLRKLYEAVAKENESLKVYFIDSINNEKMDIGKYSKGDIVFIDNVKRENKDIIEKLYQKGIQVEVAISYDVRGDIPEIRACEEIGWLDILIDEPKTPTEAVKACSEEISKLKKEFSEIKISYKEICNIFFKSYILKSTNNIILPGAGMKALKDILIQARKNRHTTISEEDVLKGLMHGWYVKWSEEKSDGETAHVAIHEAGHYVAMKYLKKYEIPVIVNVIPYNGSGGCVDSCGKRIEENERSMREDIMIGLAGEVATRISLSEKSQRCRDDLRKVTEIARSICSIYGIDPSDKTQIMMSVDPKAISEWKKKQIDQITQQIIDECYIEIEKLIKEHSQEIALISEFVYNHGIASQIEIEDMLKANQ